MRLSSILAGAALALAATAPAVAAIRYKAIEMPTLPGGSYTWALGVNNLGQVVGGGDNADGYERGLMWSPSSPTPYSVADPSLHGQEFEGINDAGQTTGMAFFSNGTISHAALFAPGDAGEPGKTLVANDLGPESGYGSWGMAINQAGQVTGWESGQVIQPFFYSDGVRHDLGVLPGGDYAVGTALNNLGAVVGYGNFTINADGDLWSGNDYMHAFVYQDGVMTDLGVAPGGNYAQALGINDAGVIVGQSTFGSGDDETTHAFVLSNGVWTDLGLLGDGTGGSAAFAINASGDIVGASSYGPITSDSGLDAYSATLWRNGRLYDLNDLIDPQSGWRLSQAYAISNTGFIVGEGFLNGQQRGFLLQALPGVPEPASWALMLLGFGAVGASLRSRGKLLAA